MNASKKKVIIAGAGEAGQTLLSEFIKRGEAEHIAGFIDDDKALCGSLIEEKQVLGSSEDISAIIHMYSITEVIIAMPSASGVKINSLVNAITAKDPDTVVHIVPSAERYFESVPLYPSLQEISFFDLTGRDECVINASRISGKVKGKTVLVTGAGGSIGSEICRQLLKFSPRKIACVGKGENSIYNLALIMQDYTEYMENPPEISYYIGDVRDRMRMEQVFTQARPDVVFHAAAHKHVPLMEYNEAEAVQNNVLGTLNMLELSAEFSVENFVLISTDKAVRPANVMGATKRLAELLTGYYSEVKGLRTAIVRFGNVIGSRGSVIPLFVSQIRNGGPVTVTHPEVTRYFMSIPEASLLVINAAAISEGGEIYVLDMGEQFKVSDIAERLIRLHGYEPGKDIDVVYTGLRPGEKLYEELFYDPSLMRRTSNDRIFELSRDSIVTERSSIETFIRGGYDSLHKLGPNEIREFLARYVPEYNYRVPDEDCRLKTRIVN